MSKKKTFVILMAEDNEHDIIATKRAWKKYRVRNPLYIVKDGEECLDYLYNRGKYSKPKSAPSPDILLLDIKMPKMDGLKVLKHIREDENLKQLPVIILTISAQEKDKMESYDLGITDYIVKPVSFEKLAEAIESFNLFWELVELPDESLPE